MWSLYNQQNQLLQPLKFSNGKTQEKVVEEVLQAIQKGHKIIFIHGVCGTGKSGIALNIASTLGSASIVVPVKYLQKQYANDYTKEFYIKKQDNNKLNIQVLTGRNNHACLYTNKTNADDPLLPCDIELKAENWGLIQAYLKQNPKIDLSENQTPEDLRRGEVAVVCPYWSPILPKEMGSYGLKDAKQHHYLGLEKKHFIYHERKPGCTYYEQFKSYIKPEVLIFNSKKYEIEVLLDRKPLTEVEIIDECDEFLDSLLSEKHITLEILQKKANDIAENKTDETTRKVLRILVKLIDNLLQKKWLQDFVTNREVLPLKESGIQEILELLSANDFLAENESLEQYVYIAEYFKNYQPTTFVGFFKSRRKHHVARIVNINLQQKFKEYLTKNKAMVLMSGTLHTPVVLRDIFGLNDLVIIEAETKQPGTIHALRTGYEKNFRYKELDEGRVTRDDYLKALDNCVKKAPRPVLIHVNSYLDLPSEEEKQSLNLGLMTREELKELQEKYRHGELLKQFKEKVISELYSTKCGRGVDLPGDICKSIVFTKYPYPSMDGIFWRVMRKLYPQKFMNFYFDKAYREFVQRVYRGLRHKEDSVNLLSPDTKIFETLYRLQKQPLKNSSMQ